MEAFEKELNGSKEKSEAVEGPAGMDEEDEGEVPADTSHLDIVDEAELGENPFANARATEVPIGIDAGNEAWLKSDRDYAYPEVSFSKVVIQDDPNAWLQLLTRFYGQLHAANPSLLSSTAGKRYTIAPPSIHREGNKKSIFANIADICKRMHRQVSRLMLE